MSRHPETFEMRGQLPLTSVCRVTHTVCGTVVCAQFRLRVILLKRPCFRDIALPRVGAFPWRGSCTKTFVVGSEGLNSPSPFAEQVVSRSDRRVQVTGSLTRRTNTDTPLSPTHRMTKWCFVIRGGGRGQGEDLSTSLQRTTGGSTVGVKVTNMPQVGEVVPCNSM